MAKQDSKVDEEVKESKVTNLTKEDLTKEYEELGKSYNEVLTKLNELSSAKLKLEGALINLQELIKKFE